VVVRGREEGEVSEGVKGSSVLGSGVSDGGSVSGDSTRELIVGSLSSNEETVSGSDGVGGEGRSLVDAFFESGFDGFEEDNEKEGRWKGDGGIDGAGDGENGMGRKEKEGKPRRPE